MKTRHTIPFILSFLFVIVTSCNQNHTKKGTTRVPEWSRQAIWYQIFVERFRNGAIANDPTGQDIRGAYPDTVPANWAVTAWTHDWYKPDPWFLKNYFKNSWDNVQNRRYGGDLQGIIDKLDYLADLGITAIYFNPLNDAPSLHKYDARNWHHIDRNFGPDPRKDEQIIAAETPDKPETWQWTEADKLFLKLIGECKKRHIKVVVDYSFNHTGKQFWAYQDVKKNGKKSKFVDWYNVESFDNPATKENEFRCKGWLEIDGLPELSKDIEGNDHEFPFEGNLHSLPAKQHIFDVAMRWIDPNGDGNPADGVDGYRLDVAAEVPKGFWREFRKKVKAANPEFYLIGEIWWKKWPDELLDPQEFLKGDMFDAVMNYRWFQQSYNYFSDTLQKVKVSDFVSRLNELNNGISIECLQAAMNLAASHDAPRLSTTLYNGFPYKFHEKPFDDPSYKIDKPDQRTHEYVKMLLVHQFTYFGSPHIYYGDEAGMWGSDDPDCRKPMVWSDFRYDSEQVHPLGLKRKIDEVKPDTALTGFYKKLIKIRKENSVLAFGKFIVLQADDKNDILVYSRKNDRDEIIVVINKSNKNRNVKIENEKFKILTELISNRQFPSENGIFNLIISPRSAEIYKVVR